MFWIVIMASSAVVGLRSVVLGQSQPQPVLAGLQYTGQKGPLSDYTVTGFPGSAAPCGEILYQSQDSTWHIAGRTTAVGSFRIEVPNQSVGQFFAVVVRDTMGHESRPTLLRTDHPLTGGWWLTPNERGWVNIIAASTDLPSHKAEWLAKYGGTYRHEDVEPAQDSRIPKRGGADSTEVPKDSLSPAPDVASIESESPEDLLFYGYAPRGDTATCVVGATGEQFHTPIDGQGCFAIRVPAVAVAVADNELPSFLINVTTRDNQLLSAHPLGRPGRHWPKWVQALGDEASARSLSSLVGQYVPKLAFDPIGSGAPISWPSTEPAVVAVWASWCGPCIKELLELDRLVGRANAPCVSLLAISIDEDPADALRVIESNRISSLLVASDPGGEQIANWLHLTAGTRRVALPLTVTSSESGKIQSAGFEKKLSEVLLQSCR